MAALGTDSCESTSFFGENSAQTSMQERFDEAKRMRRIAEATIAFLVTFGSVKTKFTTRDLG